MCLYVACVRVFMKPRVKDRQLVEGRDQISPLDKTGMLLCFCVCVCGATHGGSIISVSSVREQENGGEKRLTTERGCCSQLLAS